MSTCPLKSQVSANTAILGESWHPFL
jgi:hypothetical protein